MGAQVAELVAACRPHNTAGLVLVTPIPSKGFPLSAEQAIAFDNVARNTDPTVAAAGRKALMASPSPEAIGALVAATPAETALEALHAWTAGPRPWRASSPASSPTLNIPTTKEKS